MSSLLPWVHLWSLDELKPGWKTWARIYRVHTLHPLLSLAAHPTSVSFDLQVLQRTSPPGSHGHFRESLTAEEVRVAFLKDRARIPLHLEKWGHDQEGPFKASEVNHSVLPTTSWSILLSRRICMQISDPAFARSVGTVTWKEIQRDKVMGVDDC